MLGMNVLGSKAAGEGSRTGDVVPAVERVTGSVDSCENDG